MHRSKLAGLVVDRKSSDLRSAADSRTAAPGRDVRLLRGEGGATWLRLDDPDLNLRIEVRSVSRPGRGHPDVESDDIEAQVTRLVRLGRSASSSCVPGAMQAPCGRRICVVKPVTSGFPAIVNEWE